MATLVIHGTFAREETWWRPGTEAAPSFADALESALVQRGLSGSVWSRGPEGEFKPDDFAWSGRNRHRDRKQAAVAIARRLGDLARLRGATASNPLRINFVAHSHGGNVALEVLRLLPRGVQVRKM